MRPGISCSGTNSLYNLFLDKPNHTIIITTMISTNNPSGAKATKNTTDRTLRTSSVGSFNIKRNHRRATRRTLRACTLDIKPCTFPIRTCIPDIKPCTSAKATGSTPGSGFEHRKLRNCKKYFCRCGPVFYRETSMSDRENGQKRGVSLKV